MASTFSPSLRIELIGDGDQSGIWGQTTNTNLGTLIEQAIAGVVSITMADANYTMTNFNGVSDEARNQVIVLSGTNTAQRNLIAPLVEKTYIIRNSTTGGFAVQVIGSSGTGVVVPNGVTTTVYCDGTNFFSALSGTVGNFTVNGTLGVTGTTSLSGALTYGGVTLSNSVTGTGSMALSASPTFTGVPAAPTAAAGTNTTQIATTAFVTQNAVLTGALVMWPTASAPSGYLICDGTAVSRTTYAALFAVIGTTFGAGDTTTTFNLPNYTNRMPIGAGGTYALAATGGSATTTLITANLPSHTHSITDPGHTHTYQGSNYQPNNAAGSIPDWIGASTMTTASAFTGITATNATGSGTAATTISPYLGVYFIIKT
jgi:microcystin-dependent protein